MPNIKRTIIVTILAILALNCTFGEAFIFGGKNTGPNARVGSAKTADVAFRANTANVALTANYALLAKTLGGKSEGDLVVGTANYALLATTANAVLWTGVNGRPTALSEFTNDSVYLTATATINTALLASTANVALHVSDGAITATSIANGSVGAIHVSPEILTSNYYGNVSLNGTVSLDRLAVASTALVAHLNADLLDGMDSSAFGDATLSNQQAILQRIGTPNPTSAGTDSVFNYLKKLDDNQALIYSALQTVSSSVMTKLQTVISSNSVKSVQRGSYTEAGGTVTITSVNPAKSVVQTVSKGSAGTVAATGSLSGSASLSPVAEMNQWEYPAGGRGSWYNWYRSANLPSYSGSISGTLSGGTTALTTRQYSGVLTNATTLTFDGPCEWQVVEFY